jgi:hypothetical protein
MKPTIFLACLLALPLVGCEPTEEAPAEPNKGPITGEIDKELAGAYKANDGMTYEFGEDGSFTLKGQVSTPKGMVDRESKGEWRVDGDKLMIKDAQGYVVPYLLEKEGGNLNLTMTGKMKAETKLTPIEP